MEANLSWLTDPGVFQVNRLDAHSDHICYGSREELDRGESTLRQSLDGPWRFRWSPSAARRPEDFWQEGYDDSGFYLPNCYCADPSATLTLRSG